jgi:hypothetical protein
VLAFCQLQQRQRGPIVLVGDSAVAPAGGRSSLDRLSGKKINSIVSFENLSRVTYLSHWPNLPIFASAPTDSLVPLVRFVAFYRAAILGAFLDGWRFARRPAIDELLTKGLIAARSWNLFYIRAQEIGERAGTGHRILQKTTGF